MKKPVRWLVPIAVVATIAGGSAISSAAAESSPTVADRSVDRVLASVAGSDVTALSGVVSTRANLGLPDLGSLTRAAGGAVGSSEGHSSAATDAQGVLTRFLSGENTLRVWVDGPQHARAQLVDSFSELDVVRSGRDLWTYSSHDSSAAHAVLPAGAAHPETPAAKTAAPEQFTPATLAKQAIAAANPTTEVSLGQPVKVAGQSAYLVLITPRTTATLVDHLAIAVDAANGVPLRVQIFARNHVQPAFESGFSSVSFAKPAAELFAFTAPKGTAVQQLTVPQPPTAQPTKPQPDAVTRGLFGASAPVVSGTGWTSVVQTKAGALPGNLSGPFEQLTMPVKGGRAVSTTLLSILFTDDGRVFAGSVPVQTLLNSAAGSTAAGK